MNQTYIAVRPGMGLALYYSRPLHEMVESIEQMVKAFLDFIPKQAITALCGVHEWQPFSSVRLANKLKNLRRKTVDWTNIDLCSGPLLASEGPYGWHLNGGNLSNTDTYPHGTNVFYYELSLEEISRVGIERLIDWAVHVAEIYPFESGQFGYSFNKLQRTWTGKADDFVGDLAMQYRGFDILEPELAREARGYVPNCSWLTFLGASVISKLGGEETIRSAFSQAVEVRRIVGGLLLRASDFPQIGDIRRDEADLDPLREVARLTKPVRVTKRLCYGTEDFRHGWIHRLDP